MKKFKVYLYLILLVLIGCFIGIYGFTLAKYVSNSVWDYYLKSKGFYFSSDYLDSMLVQNVDNLWDGESVTFNIKNNLNQVVITNYDIYYEVVCTIKGDAAAYTECHLNGTTSNMLEGVLANFQTCNNTTGDGIDVSLFNKTDCELGGYDWINQIAVKELYFDVVVTDENYELQDVVVNISATSTSPYRKTLSGDFVLHKSNMKDASITADYKNYANYDRLTISNSYTSSKCVRVTWNDDKLIINADENQFSSYGTSVNGYINEIKFNLEGKKSLSFIFYKKTFNNIYNIDEFVIEESDGC